MILEVPHKAERAMVRRMWKSYPCEYIEAILGRRRRNRASVAVFYPINHTSDRTTTFAADDPHIDPRRHYEEDMYESARDEAADLGFDLLGMIHSHPGYNTCQHMSESDTESFMDAHVIIEGIVHIFRCRQQKHDTVCYHSPFEPVKVHYI